MEKKSDEKMKVLIVMKYDAVVKVFSARHRKDAEKLKNNTNFGNILEEKVY